jgi:WD40 repeat protein
VKIQVEKKLQLTGHNAAVYGLCQGHSPDVVYSAAGEGWVVQWDLRQPELGRLVAKTENNIFSLRHLLEHEFIVAGNMTGGVHWIDLNDPANTRNIQHHEMGVFDILEIGDFVFTAGGKGMLTKWSGKERRTLESLKLSAKSLRSLAWHPQLKLLAIGASDQAIYWVDPEKMVLVDMQKEAHENSVFSIAFSQDGKKLLSGGRDALLKAWKTKLTNPPLLKQLPAHWYTINAIAVHPKGEIFATASRDKSIKLWSQEDLSLLKVIETPKYEAHLNSVNRLLWIPERDLLLSASDDRTILGWKIETV